MGKEAQIQKKILDHLNRLPATVAWKIQNGNERGIPDVLCCHHGRFVAIEVKCPGLHPTPIQRAQMDRITAAKGLAAVARSVGDVERLLIGVE